jgi:double-strand break repair protein AddB
MAEWGGVYGLPPGVDFAAEVAAGLRARMAEEAPETMARVRIYVNTALMRRRILAALAAAGPGFLPRIAVVSEIGSDPLCTDLPAPVSPLRRKLELAQLIERLIAHAPDTAPRAAAFDLARTLHDLIEEMASEGVAPATLAALDVSAHAAHWDRARQFLAIATGLALGPDAPPDAATRQRAGVLALSAEWEAHPPPDPVLVAGSTGSRGSTALLMQAVARLPRGALILPGYDPDLPAEAWAALDDRIGAEDHPQTRYRRLLDRIGADRGAVGPWTAALPPDPARNTLISLALRPAPVTDQWLAEANKVGDAMVATAGMTLIEAPSPRAEAGAIALVMREALESAGQRVALVTPDRTLARQVAAALDRWGIVADDSAGEPLGQTPPGRLLRHVADLRGRRAGILDLLVVLKHPLVCAGPGRGAHLGRVRALEARLRAKGPVFPDGASLGQALATMAAAGQDAAESEVWGAWLCPLLDQAAAQGGSAPLGQHVEQHRTLAEALARGPSAEGAALWQGPAGEAARGVMDRLAADAGAGGAFDASGFARLLADLLGAETVREGAAADPRAMIRGTREARSETADIIILGGLNDGVWPSLPPPDPWLNRPMRMAAGLVPPERRIGLAAHDFMQAVAARRVMLTRALRDAEAPTLPSRWLNRLTNLLGGMTGHRGPEALSAMQARGAAWLGLATALEAPESPVPRAPRPSPRPPPVQRPRKLSVTEIETLIRDPYAIYARHVLRLEPLEPLRPEPDPALRGSVLHKVLEGFVGGRPGPEDEAAAVARLIATAQRVLRAEVPWPTARSLWLARIARVASAIVRHDRALGGVPVVVERRGAVSVGETGFTLSGRPDRIDLGPDGRAIVTDYKSGQPPSPARMEHFDKQLPLLGAMTERGAFHPPGAVRVARMAHFSLADPKAGKPIEPGEGMLDEVWGGLVALIRAYSLPAQGFTARRAAERDDKAGEYDGISRHGEWDIADPAVPVDVGWGLGGGG